jgi:CRISPR/Cas system CSM-associated protein Csm3 (group 7 of RAMP superfamily)
MSKGWRESRKIVERIVVEGDLVLLTPASLGNGDSDGLTDMSLLLDEYEGRALLTGTSTAGALRNYLREYLLNYDKSEESQYKNSKGDRLKVKDVKGNIVKEANGKPLNVSLPIVTQLFGSLDDDGAQSCLIVDDSIGGIPQTELRDGVRIDVKTRTAFVDKKGKGSKFDLELLEAGTTFKLRFELLISEGQNRTDFVSAFGTALQGFERSEIFIGARKRRGYGECKVSKWRVKTFDLIAKDKTGLIDWLRTGAKSLADLGIAEYASITSVLGPSSISDQREYFEMKACFALDGSMLIRSGSKLPNVGEKGQPDTVHLRSKHKDKGRVPIVSGTSLAGVLRHRAVKICNTIAEGRGKSFVEKIFGVDMEELKERNKAIKEQPYASRLEVKETFIENISDLVQTRVKIDRFTGGAFEGALFDAAPIFARSNEKAIEISLRLRKPSEAEIGLLLLLLKDLWTSDLAIGGESSIGRGRLKGVSANLRNKMSGQDELNIGFNQTLSLSDSDRNKLNGYVKTLNDELK